jgi:hypothetical protein
MHKRIILAAALGVLAGHAAWADVVPPPAPTPTPPANTIPDDELHPRAKIIQSFRDDDGQLKLYIDRGSAANIKAGMHGVLLEGPEGDKPVEGSDFVITKVIDENHSVGKSKAIRKLGKNTRCVIKVVADPK